MCHFLKPCYFCPMTHSKCLFCLLFILFILGCGARTPGASPSRYLTNEDVVGRWRTESLEISIESHNNLKADSSFEMNPHLMAEASGNQPPVTYLMPNGNYKDELISLAGETVRLQTGFWHLDKDTLYIRLENPPGQNSQFHVRKKGQNLLLGSQVDWDADGKKDDELAIRLSRY